MIRGTTIDRIADFVVAMRSMTVPDALLYLCEAQRRSILTAVGTGFYDPAWQRAAQRIPHDPATWVDVANIIPETDASGLPRVHALDDAAMASVALDFDDYMLFCHPGHSSVLASLAGEMSRSPGKVARAQLCANEVAARLSAATLLGPTNGLLVTHIHAVGVVAAWGVLHDDMPREQVAHALALALWQSHRPTWPGFLGPDSKVTLAADAIHNGARAFWRARAGLYHSRSEDEVVSGPLDILDAPNGFLSAFSYAPLRAMLERFPDTGGGWATRTLCVKASPGCAYVSTVIEAAQRLPHADSLEEVEAIERIDVHAGLLTLAMEALSAPYSRPEGPSPPTAATITASVPWNVAIAICCGGVAPFMLHPDFLRPRLPVLQALAGKVRVHHDRGFTQTTLASFKGVLSPRAILRPLGLFGLGRALYRMSEDVPSVGLGLRDALAFWQLLCEGLPGDSFRPWDDGELASFVLRMPARVVMRMKDGHVFERFVVSPRGAAGSVAIDSPYGVSTQKWEHFGRPVFDGSKDLRPSPWVDAIDAPHLKLLMSTMQTSPFRDVLDRSISAGMTAIGAIPVVQKIAERVQSSLTGSSDHGTIEQKPSDNEPHE